MVILVVVRLICGIFDIFYCKFWHGSLSNGMAFQSCSVLFRDPINLLLRQTKQPNTRILTAAYAKILRKNFLSNFKLYGSRKL